LDFIVDTNGGGDGIRTRVLHSSCSSFYECSLFFILIAWPPTDRVPNYETVLFPSILQSSDKR